MKEVHETVVLNVPEMSQSHFPSNMNLLRSLQLPRDFQPESSVTSGEAPMDVEKEDESTTPVAGNMFLFVYKKECFTISHCIRLELAISNNWSTNSRMLDHTTSTFQTCISSGIQFYPFVLFNFQ